MSMISNTSVFYRLIP